MISTWFCEKIDIVQVTSLCKVDDIWEFVTRDVLATENCLLSVYIFIRLTALGVIKLWDLESGR